MGQVKSMSMMGYNSEKRAYTLHVIDSMGVEISAQGTVSGGAIKGASQDARKRRTNDECTMEWGDLWPFY
jgi:hypothetical protein